MIDILLANMPTIIGGVLLFIAWRVRAFFLAAEDSRQDELAEALEEMESDLEPGTGLIAHQHHYVEVPYWAQFLARRFGMAGRSETHATVRQTTL